MTIRGAVDLPDQSGRTVIVTGASSGLGAETARRLARVGAKVILACRDEARGRATADEIGESTTVQRLDLADLASIREFAASVAEVDVLLNNAGVMATPPGRTVDGFETQVGINHLGHFALTALLLDRIRDRIVTVSSGVHILGKVVLSDLNWASRRYRRWPAYSQSKLANLMFAYELQRRLTAVNSEKLSVAVHPGYARTNLHRHARGLQSAALVASAGAFGQSAEMGALPLLYAATGAVAAGGYYGPGGLGGLRGHPAPARSSATSHDEETARLLWNLSEQLTGTRFAVT